jgi:predicted ATPase/DNA-binding SARP family transcriptional activator
MEVGILGPLLVADGAQSIEVGGARLRALLIRLASSAGGWVSVDELVEALWESDPPSDELNALQSLVSRLRRALPTPQLIESGPAGYRLAVEPTAVDGIRFERLAVQGRRRLRDGHPEEASTLLSEALKLWRGAPLTEVIDVPYAMTWAQRLEKLRLAAIENWAAAGLQLGRHPELVGDLEEVVEQHPLRERSHELLIRALAGSARQAEALAVYDRLSRRLAEELGLDPPVHIQHLQTAVLRSDPEELIAADRLTLAPAPVYAAAIPPAPPAPRLRRTNLRSPLTSFVGRDDEIAQLSTLFRHGARLITLIGTGGAGKTRLASEAMTRLRDLGSGGVWMAELAPVTDPEDVASAVLGSIDTVDLQILERPGRTHRDPFSRLIDSLADHDCVLILDNCEHVLDAAAKLAEFLLGACPRLTVLATSREPLGIVGESLCQVQPLSMPALDSTGPAAQAAPAVQLFIDRAALVRPGFTMTTDNAGAVLEVCRRLDGLPLAIELAAARLRNLPVEAIAARLGNRFRLLTGGNRTAMPRHQTLRAVVAWSWDLLTNSEQILAERLSVFPGGATVETATAVCASDASSSGALSEDTVADLLMLLADKSLLVVVEPTDPDDGAQPRYRMLETIREFAAERLSERGESAARRAVHAKYFLDLAETAEPKLRGADQLPWVNRLTAERDNLHAALRFASETSDADTAIRLVAALGWYWILTGRHDEPLNLVEQALKVPGERPAQGHAIVLMMHTISVAMAGSQMPGPDQLEKLRTLVSAIDLADRHPLLALVEPGLAMVTDDGAAAKLALERNLAHPDPWTRAMLHLMSAVQGENDGDVETMKYRIPLAMAGFRAIGDRWGIGTTAAEAAYLDGAQGRLEEAIAALQESRQLMIQLRATDDECYALSRIGMLRLRQGDVAGARKDVEAALEIADRTGSWMSIGFGTFHLAVLAHHEGRTDQALVLAYQALAAVDRAPFSPPQVKALIHGGIATFNLSSGNVIGAAERLRDAYQAAQTSKDMPVAAIVATGVAELLLARGDAAAAAQLLGAGVRLRGIDDVSDLDVQRVASAARSVLGPDGYARHHESGRNLAREAALNLIEVGLKTSSLTGQSPESPGPRQVRLR